MASSSRQSPFSHIIETCAAPSPAQKQSIEEFIASLAEEHARIGLLITELQKQRESVERSMVVHQATLSPWRRIPSELWLEIFMLAIVSDDSDGLRMSSLCPENPTIRIPWTIAGVCRKWREIMLAHPSLWSSIKICPRTPSRVREQLKHSREALLHISICHCDRDDLEVTTMLDALSPLTHRFRYLSTPSLYVFRFPPPFPQLTHLRVIGNPSLLSTHNVSSNFGATRLRHLQLEIPTRLSFNCFRDAISWGNLTNMKICTYFPDTLIASIVPVISHLEEHLVNLELRLTGQPTHDEDLLSDASIGRFTMSSLKSLSLIMCGIGFIPLLITPCLESLYIYDYNFLSDITQAITDFIHRSKCTLGSLSLIRGRRQPWLAAELHSADALQGLLSDCRITQTLSELCVVGAQGALDFDDKTSQKPSITPTQALPQQGLSMQSLPRIQRLILARRVVDPTLFRDFLDRTHSSTDSGPDLHCPLKYLILDEVHGYLQPGIRAKLDYLKDSGVEVREAPDDSLKGVYLKRWLDS